MKTSAVSTIDGWLKVNFASCVVRQTRSSGALVQYSTCVMVRPWEAGIYPKIRNWSVFVLFGWRFVFGIIMNWEGREPSHSDDITTLGNKKAASLLLLSFAKLSSTKDLTNRQTCQRILCVST